MRLLFIFSILMIGNLLFAQSEGNTDAVETLTIGTALLNMVAGIIIFYAQKNLKVIFAMLGDSKVFDAKFWWRENKTPLLWVFIVNLAMLLISFYAKDLAKNIYDYIGLDIDYALVGTIPFTIAFTLAVYEFILKKIFKKTIVLTDGKGNRV